MIKIIQKTVLLIALVFVTVTAVFAFLIFADIHPNKLLGYEVYDALEEAERANSFEAVLLGDSVSRQLCPPEKQGENGRFCYLSTNQAVTVVGNYILLCRYLENHPQTKQVVYMVQPVGLANNMRSDFSYQYFVLPFYQEPYLDYMDEDTRRAVKEKFGGMFISNPVFRYILRNSSVCLERYLDRIHDDETEFVPELTIRYLGRMQELCDRYGAEFILVSSPLNEGFDYDTQRFMDTLLQTEDEEMRGLFERYDASLRFYPKECFADDVHFSSDYLEAHREEILSAYPEIHDAIAW